MQFVAPPNSATHTQSHAARKARIRAATPRTNCTAIHYPRSRGGPSGRKRDACCNPCPDWHVQLSVCNRADDHRGTKFVDQHTACVLQDQTSCAYDRLGSSQGAVFYWRGSMPCSPRKCQARRTFVDTQSPDAWSNHALMGQCPCHHVSASALH